ncbi:MAG TPA: IS5 family transposase [Candidatus Nanoarchaeia archaeon]|nr:IS5 family transposase [Candidatus Nanoarchaeia archaeon]
MESLIDFALREKYSKVKSLRSRLEDMKKLIDWNAFLPLFPERESLRGRPNYEKIVMVKLLFLQGWYGLSDEELEFQVNDRLSFQQFLDFPKTIPDYSTIWRFREELAEDTIIDTIWSELQRQIESKHIKVEKGVIQDASFIIAEPGKTDSGMSNRGRMANTSRSKDGSWTKKGDKSYFGYKVHTKMQRGSKIVKELAVTTARVHDTAIDLSKPDEVVYRDKGYTGAKTHALGNATMMRGNLTPHETLRNKRIQKKRSQGEHPFGTIHRAMHGGETRLTTVYRVFIQQVFVFAAYNLFRLASVLQH